MNPVVRFLGKMLRLVGISSPEDTQNGPKAPKGAPSWRNASRPESPPPPVDHGDRS